MIFMRLISITSFRRKLDWMSLWTKSFVISLENYCEETRRAIRLGRCIFARVSHVLEWDRSFKMKKRFRFHVEKGESNDERERKEKKEKTPRKSEERDSGKICEFGRFDASNISGSRKFFARGVGGLDFTRPSDFRASRVWLAHANPENISFLAGFAPRPHSSTGLALFPSAKHFLIRRWHLYLQ